VHVLRLVGKPLHYKEITDVAIEKDLLSHVGKSPEVTMGARLAAIVKKGSKETPLTRVKPGVFALVDWDDAMIEQGLQDRTPALKRIADRLAQGGQIATEAELTPEPADETGGIASDAPAVKMGQDEITRAELTAAATELFAAEEDDDEPILGNLDEDEEEEDEEGDAAGKRRRRRRRGRGRVAERDDDLPAYTVTDAAEGVSVDAAVEVRKPREPERTRDNRERSRDFGRDRDASRDREAGRGDAGRDRDAHRERSSEDGDRNEVRVEDYKAGRADEMVGSDLAGLVEAMLGEFRRQGGATSKQLAELAVRKGRAGAADGQLASLFVVACRADNLRRQAAGERERFRIAQGKLLLTEWSLDRELLKLEKDIAIQIERYQSLGRQRLARRISELPPKAIGEIVMLLLERLDYGQFQVIKRAASHPSELHLSAVLKTPIGETTVAVVIRRDGRDVGRERVTDLRGSMHHYGRATLGLLVTTGQVMSGARDEAAAPGATPVTFLDGTKLSQLCDQYGIGVTRSPVVLSIPDAEFFDSLRAG
jgi:Restriction endonuclease/HB1, ASXL, restriction endonuclease HTH domain